MKKLFYIISFAVVTLSACDTTSSDNGDLDSMWYLTKVDTLSNGHSVDYRSNRVFWSFQGTLLQFNCADSKTFYMSQFEMKDGSLIIKSPFYYDRVHGDRYIEESTINEISLFGLNSILEKFSVETLDNSTMVLKGTELQLTFEKY